MGLGLGLKGEKISFLLPMEVSPLAQQKTQP